MEGMDRRGNADSPPLQASDPTDQTQLEARAPKSQGAAMPRGSLSRQRARTRRAESSSAGTNRKQPSGAGRGTRL